MGFWVCAHTRKINLANSEKNYEKYDFRMKKSALVQKKTKDRDIEKSF